MRTDYCMAIEAEFVYGPVRCGRRATTYVIDDEGDQWSVCDEHSGAA